MQTQWAASDEQEISLQTAIKMDFYVKAPNTVRAGV